MTRLLGVGGYYRVGRYGTRSSEGVAVFYLVVSLSVGEGIDINATEEKPLLARIVVMYALVAIVNLVSRQDGPHLLHGSSIDEYFHNLS